MNVCYDALRRLRETVAQNRGASEIVVIANGGDGPSMEEAVRDAARLILRADGKVRILSHEERTRRGQWLGLLDSAAHWKERYGDFDRESVSLGVMLAGKGSRLSPLTQRFYGIKPLIPCPVREGGRWLTSAAASLFCWNLTARCLGESGFRGMAWKWGDEPQFPSSPLWSRMPDLRDADVVRFGSYAPITDELAENKEWLYGDGGGNLTGWVRRRKKEALLKLFGLEKDPDPHAWIHIGSPAFSYVLLDCAAEVFADVPQHIWIDVDGFLMEAFLYGETQWNRELENSLAMQKLVSLCPDFYERCRLLKTMVARRKGGPFSMKAVDFGRDFYWADLGQLEKARACFSLLAQEGPAGDFARELAAMGGAARDFGGNWVCGKSEIGDKSALAGSVVIDSSARIARGSRTVLIGSSAEDFSGDEDSVCFGTAVGRIHMGKGSMAVLSRAAGELYVPDSYLHTSMPAAGGEPEDWWADVRINTGEEGSYREKMFGNPRSFEAQQELMRDRRRSRPGAGDYGIAQLNDRR